MGAMGLSVFDKAYIMKPERGGFVVTECTVTRVGRLYVSARIRTPEGGIREFEFEKCNDPDCMVERNSAESTQFKRRLFSMKQGAEDYARKLDAIKRIKKAAEGATLYSHSMPLLVEVADMLTRYVIDSNR